MKKRKIYPEILGLVLLFTMFSCNNNYLVGVSVISIEPANETVSLTLAGYAAPYQGRFSLTWDDMGLFGKMTDLAAVGNDLYAVNDKKELLQVTDENFTSPTVIMTSVPVKYVTAIGSVLYGINDSGELMACNLRTGKPEWEKLEITGKVTAITSSSGYLYIITGKGKLRKGLVSDKIIWTEMGELKDVCSLACDGNRLYALTNDKMLYRSELKNDCSEWLRIGYNNGDSYTIDASRIVYSQNRLLALGSDDHIYGSRHNTEGKLSARAMSIAKGKDTVIIVGVDICGFDYSFTNGIKDEIYRRRGVSPEAILINASHTHFAPVSQSWITWEEQHQRPDSLYLTHVVREGIIQAIEESIDNMVMSDLSFGRDTTDIGWNRSLKGELAIYDNSVDVLQVTAKDLSNKNILFLTGCHPVYTDPDAGTFMISPNYPGFAREVIEKESKSSASMFLQACAGDINPKDPFKVSGRKLATSVMHILSDAMHPIEGDISYHLDTINVPITPWSEAEVISYRDSAEKNLENGVSRRDYRWANLMIDHYKNGTMPHSMPVYVQTFNIGNWKLIGLSREVATEYSFKIKDLYPDKLVSVLGYTNDVASYLATDPHISAKDYEGYDSFFWYGQPSFFPLKTLDTVVNEIKDNNR